MLIPGTGAGAQLTRCGTTAGGATASGATTASTLCATLCTTVGHLFLLGAPENKAKLQGKDRRSSGKATGCPLKKLKAGTLALSVNQAPKNVLEL